MATRMVNLVIDAERPSALAAFWADLLAWRITADHPDEVAVEAPAADGCDLKFVFRPVSEPKIGKNRLHLDLASTSDRHQRETVARAVSLGARTIDIGQGDVPWTVLADPEGNEFCVLEPRATYAASGAVAAIVVEAHHPGALAGFWSPLIGWPITADEPAITTLRNPAGRGPTLEFLRSDAQKHGKNRLHLDLAPHRDDDQAAESRRLRAAGARIVALGQADLPWTVLADPEDNEFCLLAPR